MSEYKKVLYLDSDMIALDDVSDLFDEDIAGYYLAAVRDMDVIGSYKSIPYTKQYIDNSLMLENPLKYFQAGVLLLNIAEMKKTISTELLVEKTLEQKWDMVDQDVLNISCHGRVKFLSQKWNVLMNWRNNGRSRMEVMQCVPRDLYTEYMEARSNPKIIHYAGLWKPWNTPGCDYFVNFWEEARKSPFYEMILYKNLSQNANGLASQLDPNMRVIRLKPTRIELRINMKKVNKILPANSVRRRVVRAMVGRFL